MQSFHTTADAVIQSGPNQSSYKAQAADAAQKLYQQARSRSWLDKLRSSLGGRSHRLLDLVTVRTTCKGLGHRELGRQRVAMSQIQGSANEGRCRDFDADFRPLKAHNEERWLNVAVARQQGATLPPVALIQVGDVYFVKDGHHRISVARALGQTEIEAVVTVWQVVGLLPWEDQETAIVRPAEANQSAVPQI